MHAGTITCSVENRPSEQFLSFSILLVAYGHDVIGI